LDAILNGDIDNIVSSLKAVFSKKEVLLEENSQNK
jgi:hypothetical protein